METQRVRSAPAVEATKTAAQAQSIRKDLIPVEPEIFLGGAGPAGRRAFKTAQLEAQDQRKL